MQVSHGLKAPSRGRGPVALREESYEDRCSVLAKEREGQAEDSESRNSERKKNIYALGSRCFPIQFHLQPLLKHRTSPEKQSQNTGACLHSNIQGVDSHEISSLLG